jgi:DNA-formamidopyrimidine glycosylase
MPEGPEVKIMTDQLCSRLKDRHLFEINIIGGKFIRLPPDNINLFKNILPNKIIDVKCKGKFIYFTFSNNWYIFNTLGMTGNWSEVKEKHSSIHFKLEDGDIYFNDARRFGTFKCIQGNDVLQQKLNSLGLDLLSAAINNDNIKYRFRNLIKDREDTLAEALMNQKIFSGVGNYIKSETLYRSRLSPWRICNSLSNEEYYSLAQNTIDILLESYKLGGATLATYKNFEGKTGWYADKLQVYKKLKDPLGNNVKSESTYDKRTSWWVPEVQK